MIYTEIKSRLTLRSCCEHMGYEINQAGYVCCDGERTASLKIFNDEHWHCFRCDEGGDCIDLLMHMERWSAWKATDYCASLAGVERNKDTQILPIRKDAEALIAARTATSLDLPYGREHFISEASYGLFIMILLHGMQVTNNTEIMRQQAEAYGCSWDKRLNPELNEVIDWLWEEAE